MYMAADSYAADVDTSSGLTLSAEKAVINGAYLLGACTSFQMSNLLKFATLPDPPKNVDELYRFMVMEFVPALADFVEKAPGKHTREGMIEDTDILVATRGKLFIVDDEWSVMDGRYPFMAVGSGYTTAMGSLYTSAPGLSMTPVERLTTALDAAAEFSTGVRRPFTSVRLSI